MRKRRKEIRKKRIRKTKRNEKNEKEKGKEKEKEKERITTINKQLNYKKIKTIFLAVRNIFGSK